MSRKCILLLTILLLPGFACWSQALQAVKLNDYPKLRFDEHFKSRNHYYLFDTKLFILSDFSIQVVDSNSKSKSFDLAKLDKSISKNISRAYSTESYFDGYHLFLMSRHYVFAFIYKGNTFSYQRSYKLEKKYGSHLYFNGKDLIVYEIYNHHPRGENYKAGYTSINPETGIAVYHPLNFHYFPITHFQPNNFVSFGKYFYLLADPFTYNITAYDYNDTKIDSFTVADTVFKVTDKIRHFSDTVLAKQMAYGPSDFFAGLNADLRDVDRIWTIHLLDSATVYIRLTRNSIKTDDKQGQQFFDHIWKKSGKQWVLTQTKYIAIQDLKRDITQADLWPYFFPGAQLVYSEGMLSYLFWAASGSALPQNGEDFYGIKSFDRSHMHLKSIRFKVVNP